MGWAAVKWNGWRGLGDVAHGRLAGARALTPQITCNTLSSTNARHSIAVNPIARYR
jgi:hypothetical protein